MSNYKKVAIAYDWIDKWGGVERLLLELHKILPDAPIYTSYYEKEKAPWAAALSIRTSYMQRLPKFIRHSRLASFLFYPYAFESFDFSDYDVVISVSSSFAKGIITKPGTQHVSILLTPTRYLWALPQKYRKQGFMGWVQGYIAEKMRRWDYLAAQRADIVYAISELVRDRTATYYNRNAEVLYPPFSLSYWSSIQGKLTKPKVEIPKSYYLVVSRLEPYKAVDTVIDAFAQLTDKKLVVIGNGSLKKALEERASSNVYMYSDLSDNELAWVYSHAEALLMPQEEDFGYVAFEAIYFNCPIITYRKNYTATLVSKEGIGLVFPDQSSDAICKVLETFLPVSYNVKENLRKKNKKIIEMISDVHFSSNIKTICH